MQIEWLIIIISLLLSAFFSGMEIAYVSSNKLHIEIEKKQNSFIAKALKNLTEKPSKFIATMLLGNNIALVVYGLFMGDVLTEWLAQIHTDYSILYYFTHDAKLFTQTLISTALILITAEFLPKVFFQIYANQIIRILALPAIIFYYIFWLFTDFIIGFTDLILKKIFKVKGDTVQLNFTKVELGHYISEHMESTEVDEEIDSEIQIFQNALEFSNVKAREVMIPRNEIIAVEIDENPKNLIELFTKTGLSKILVYKETNDDIVGYVHSFEMFKHPEHISEILRSVIFVPETVHVKEILNNLIKKQKSIAVVIDEYGGTSGMMTVEDIVEELFGEIEDEHDPVVLIEEEIDKNTYQLSARHEVDYLNEKYKIGIPKSESYETLGGYIMSHTEEIPEASTKLVFDHFKIKILEASSKKIELIQLSVNEIEDR
ncbi:hemolysin family protein [Mesohalobacter halotolerans]|uniref:HlyC/CorC family transporter n=1 Tax=Mesohalobacter halotolerans TaxID=1883405 RepID=A0A4U5TSU8_9FLAO|nr:hemolysin family protein [Mesohalobacter halotolerans]TKS57417.1 HlyC/CorC family transporter [Mesohalobacter halotolerans]